MSNIYFPSRQIQQWMVRPTDKRQNPPLYMLLDAARSEEIYPLITGSYSEYQCLFQGESATSLADVAPYILRLTHDSHFTDRLIRKSWGESWGIYFTSADDMAALCKHFRQFTIVKSSQYKSLYFRFYDPRILRNFLPTCSQAELSQFFGPIDRFILEDEEAASCLEYSYNDKDQTLHTSQMQMDTFAETL